MIQFLKQITTQIYEILLTIFILLSLMFLTCKLLGQFVAHVPHIYVIDFSSQCKKFLLLNPAEIWEECKHVNHAETWTRTATNSCHLVRVRRFFNFNQSEQRHDYSDQSEARKTISIWDLVLPPTETHTSEYADDDTLHLIR